MGNSGSHSQTNDTRTLEQMDDRIHASGYAIRRALETGDAMLLRAINTLMSAPSAGPTDDALPFVVEYARKPEHVFSGWRAMAAFDHEGPAENYAKKCAEGDTPWQYRVRPQPAATEERS